jgi:hypothetical protein
MFSDQCNGSEGKDFQELKINVTAWRKELLTDFNVATRRIRRFGK